jgi:hypothetical protein
MKKKIQLKNQCAIELHRLLDFFGTKAEMARKFGVSTNAISYWFSRGQIGRFSAMKLNKMKSVPFTKESLRPDIMNWVPVNKR